MSYSPIAIPVLHRPDFRALRKLFGMASIATAALTGLLLYWSVARSADPIPFLAPGILLLILIANGLIYLYRQLLDRYSRTLLLEDNCLYLVDKEGERTGEGTFLVCYGGSTLVLETPTCKKSAPATSQTAHLELQLLDRADWEAIQAIPGLRDGGVPSDTFIPSVS